MSLVFHNIDPPPHPPHRPPSVYPPSAFGAGGGHTRWVEKGVGGQYFGRRETQICTLHVSTLWVQRSTSVCEEQQRRFRGIYHVKRTTVEVEFLVEIQTKAVRIFLLVIQVTSTAFLEISISSNSRNLLQFL